MATSTSAATVSTTEAAQVPPSTEISDSPAHCPGLDAAVLMEAPGRGCETPAGYAIPRLAQKYSKHPEVIAMGRGKSEHTLRLIDAAYDILEEIQPATVRAVCYRLFTQGLIESMKKTETNRVSRQLTEARESIEIPWEWIVDETREAECIPSWDDPARFVGEGDRCHRAGGCAVLRHGATWVADHRLRPVSRFGQGHQ